MKFLKHIASVLIAAGLYGCSDTLQSENPVITIDEGDSFTVDLSLNIAEISKAQSRAFSDRPDYANLKLYMVEFEGGGETPLDNGYIKQISTITDEGLNADGDIHFKVTLDKADQPRILHLIAVPKDIPFEIPYGLGLEGTVIPGLVVDGETPAYWQRVEFANGYGHYVQDGDDFKWETYTEVITKLTHVPMLCNFAKVSLTVTEAAQAEGFNLEGFALLNRPDKGTVAAYNSTQNTFPTFVSGSNILGYSTIDAYYKGYAPTKKVTNADPTTEMYSREAKYLYERENSSQNNPVVIMKGNRGGASMYYKIDLGYKDNTNHLFHFYDILRNFEYSITVSKVSADGYATPQEALDGVVFNNFSFDVNTKQMLSVSDGTDMLKVNQTTFVVTSPDSTTVTLRYKYNNIRGTNTKTNNNIKFIDEQTGAENGAITGDAITSLTISSNDAADGWRTVTIKTPEPTADRQSQEIIMFDPATGLGRLITIIVRIPWQFMEPGVWGGTYYYNSNFDNSWQGYVSNSTTIGQPLTVRFRIDDNIPEAMFPLKFTFESSNQNIENNKIDNLVVNPGSSLFANVTTSVIKYVKTVTWADYNAYQSESPTGTIETVDGVERHFVKAHFLTIQPITTATTTIRIQNPYMSPTPTIVNPPNYVDVTFTGKTGTAPTVTYTPTGN